MTTLCWWKMKKMAGVLLILMMGCTSETIPPSNEKTPVTKHSVTTMRLTSSSFSNAARIDVRHTCKGNDLSPPLDWSGAPNGTKSFALICDDPDAPSAKKPAAEPWVHWVIFNIPADRAELPVGIERKLELVGLGNARQGKNSWPSENVGYRGPAPPPGSGPHRYFFKLYALDCALTLKAGATKSDVVKAMQGHVLAEGELYGTFER